MMSESVWRFGMVRKEVGSDSLCDAERCGSCKVGIGKSMEGTGNSVEFTFMKLDKWWNTPVSVVGVPSEIVPSEIVPSEIRNRHLRA
jgi:hypothetical protein